MQIIIYRIYIFDLTDINTNKVKPAFQASAFIFNLVWFIDQWFQKYVNSLWIVNRDDGKMVPGLLVRISESFYFSIWNPNNIDLQTNPSPEFLWQQLWRKSLKYFFFFKVITALLRKFSWNYKNIFINLWKYWK